MTGLALVLLAFVALAVLGTAWRDHRHQQRLLAERRAFIDEVARYERRGL